jgi:predicted RNA binding protein YcfA (HicA-like mRNA interferase family)
MNKRERLEELKANPKKIRFARICKIAEAFGFQTRQGPGSHKIYYKDGVREILNIRMKTDGQNLIKLDSL